MFKSLKEFLLIPVGFFQHSTKLTYAAVVIAAVIGILYFKIMFRKRDGFDEHPTVDLTQGAEFQWAKWKALVLIFICIVSYQVAYYQLPVWFPAVFQRQ